MNALSGAAKDLVRRSPLWRRLGGRAARLYYAQLESSLSECAVVADVGCGCTPQSLRLGRIRRRIFCEAHLPSTKTLVGGGGHPLAGDAVALPLRAKSVDAVLLLQVLEHVEKSQGLSVLEEMERVARKAVILSTPNGFVEQDAVGGNPYQVHKSGWGIRELEALGYSVQGYEGFRAFKRPGTSLYRRPRSLLANLDGLGFLSSLLRCWPHLAFQLLAVKRLDQP